MASRVSQMFASELIALLEAMVESFSDVSVFSFLSPTQYLLLDALAG